MNIATLSSVPKPVMRRAVLSAIVIAAIAGAYALALLGRSPTTSAYGPLYATHGAFEQRAMNVDIAGATAGRKSSAGTGQAPSSRTSLPPYIIRTGDITLRLRSKSALPGKYNLSQLLRAYTGSYIASVSTYDHNRFVDLQVEVPAVDFTAVFNRLEHNFGKIESESTSTQDVGLQVVNLNARLKNLSAQRLALLKLFDKATTVADTVKVENVLSNVEGQIEQTQGQIKYLAHQIAMSTISVEFQAKNASKHHTGNGAIVNAFGTAGNGILGAIAGAIIVVGYAIPLTAFGLCLYGLVLLGLRIYRRRRARAVPALA